MKPSEKKTDAALAMAMEYGGTDGAHHKMWVIDQMVRILCGPNEYAQFIEQATDGEDGPNTYEWDTGRAP